MPWLLLSPEDLRFIVVAGLAMAAAVAIAEMKVVNPIVGTAPAVIVLRRSL